jgi:hypothetical protein
MLITLLPYYVITFWKGERIPNMEREIDISPFDFAG